MAGEDTADAIIIGSGINALVAAAELGLAGWSVRILERNDRVGGFIDTQERTLSGYAHDTWSSWHPLLLSGPAWPVIGPELLRRGLSYANTSDAVTASVAGDGRTTIAYRDPDRTAAAFAHPDDRTAYSAALRRFESQADLIGGLLGTSLRSTRVVRPLGRLVARERRGTLDWGRDLASSGRGYCRRTFRGAEVDQLWVPWLLHAGLSPDSASGGLFVPIFAATMHGVGLPIPVGGAARLLDAFHALFADLDVSVTTGVDVTTVTVAGGRATGVTAGGASWHAERAVLAGVSPGALYRHLLDQRNVPLPVRREAGRYRPGRAAMQVHVALSGPVPWADPALGTVPLVHLSDGSGSTGVACAQAEAGLLPSHPTVAVGQQHVLDPTRVPAGAAALWLQLQELPSRPGGDAAGEIPVDHEWSAEVTRRYVDRVLARIERHAPGLGARVLAIDAITPVDIEAHNVNAVGGDPYGGSAELDQNFLWRPLPQADHRTPVPGLWHIGAATHPGPGLGGVSGHIVAQRLLRGAGRDRPRASLTTRLPSWLGGARS